MSNFSRKSYFLHLLSITILIFLFISTFLSVALATPSIEQKKREAAQVQAEIDRIDVQLDQAVEEYNIARIELEKVEKEVESNREELTRATEKLKKYQKILNHRVSSIYKEGMPSLIPVILNTSDFNSFLVKVDLLIKIANHDIKLVKKIIEVKKKIEATRAELEKQRQEKLAVRNQFEKQKREIEGKIAYKKAFLNNVQGEISALIRQQQERERRKQAQAVQQARAATGSENSRRGRGSSGGSSPPPRRGGGGVVSIALSYLGVPYRYGGSSPSTGFDCSGFTMYVYRQVGVSLPHSSRMQYNYGTHISRESLQPGDLVFFGLDGIHHVGIYIGGGSYVHAPRTGDVVKVSSLSARRDYAGACRL